MGSNSKKAKKEIKQEKITEEEVDEPWGPIAKFAFYFWAFLLRMVFIYMGQIIDNSRSPNVYTDK